MRARSIGVAALLGLAACAGPRPYAAPQSAAEALRPYYATLGGELPQRPAGPALDRTASLTRLAFGSCNHQERHQTIWQRIAAAEPQLFLMLGDNVYGDFRYGGDAEMRSFEYAYRLLASHPNFAAFASRIPILATWDDHDYGPNDSGGSFAFRERSEDLFESFWRSDAEVRGRPGVYQSVTAGPAGRRLQIILLDTRFFRSDLAQSPYRDPRPPLGDYARTVASDATMLGTAQWRWLANELAEPADLRLVVSSIQVLTDAHNFEKWGNVPAERERLYRALGDRNGGGIVILSGDRHSGALYRDTPAALGEEVWELTSSSLNLAFLRDEWAQREVDPKRLGDLVTAENFGTLDIDWEAGAVALRLRGNDGRELLSRRISFRQDRPTRSVCHSDMRGWSCMMEFGGEADIR